MRYRTVGIGRVVIMSTPISYDPGTAEGPSWGQTLQDFYRIHNLDEERRKYLEDLRLRVNNVSTGGPLNNLLYTMGLDRWSW